MTSYRHYSQKRTKKKDGSSVDKRITVLLCIIGIAVTAVIVRLIDVQILRGGYYDALASGQHHIYEDLVPERGSIYIEDRFSKELHPLAVNKKMYLIYAVPRNVSNPKEVAVDLAPILEMDVNELTEKLSKPDDLYEILKKQVPEEKRDEILALKHKGISYVSESVRYYTEHNFASHILGFMGYDGDVLKGRYGLEGYYDEELSGKTGFLAAEKDALGKFVIGGTRFFEEAQDGDDLVLTIDRVIQYKTEKILREATEQYGAEEGSVIVMNPQNGEVIAMANYPDYNPNDFSNVEDVSVFTNSAVYDLYEPGSAYKPIVAASAMNAGLINPYTVIDDVGSIKIDKFTIQNSDLRANGEITITEALEKSSNIVMVEIGKMLGAERLYDYLSKFGFLDLSGIDLDSEAVVSVTEPKKWTEADLATYSFGQGLVTTPLRLINGISTIANGGKLMKPHVVRKIVHADGSEELVDNSAVSQVISPDVARSVSSMMVSVVDNGNGRSAHIPGYAIAGKTGTAQVAKEGASGYDPTQKITSFAGFGPVEDPQFVILVKFNNPGGDVWGATTAAPVFKKVAEEIIRYYQIPPTKIVE